MTNGYQCYTVYFSTGTWKEPGIYIAYLSRTRDLHSVTIVRLPVADQMLYGQVTLVMATNVIQFTSRQALGKNQGSTLHDNETIHLPTVDQILCG